MMTASRRIGDILQIIENTLDNLAAKFGSLVVSCC
jgi:hypothetical protein